MTFVMERDIYPIGQQDFRNIRDNGALYVDKTQYIEKLVKSQSKWPLQNPHTLLCEI